MRRKGFIGLALAAMFVPGTLWAELPKAEQICINKMNSDGVKVQAAQLKVNDGCVKDAVKTSLTPQAVADACIEADSKGKVAKKRAKTVADIPKKCAPAPSIFFSGAVTTNDAAEEGAKALLRDVFGPGLGSLWPCDTNPAECVCQVKVINRVSKMERAMAKIWLQCKKAAMVGSKPPFSPTGAVSNAELQQCVTNGVLPGGLSVEADTKGKIADAKGQLVDTAEQFCGAGGADEFFGGLCSGFSNPPTIDGAGLANCMEDLAQCRLCEMINLTDALAIDCDSWAGIPCP